MRTSRISRDTAKVLASLSRSRRPAPPSHSSGSSPTTKTNSTTMPPAHETPSAPAQNQIDPADVAVHPHESDSDLSSVPSNFSADDQFAAAARSKKRKRGQDGPRGEAVVRTRSANRGAARAGSAVAKTEAETEVALIDTSKPKKARRAPAKKVVATNGSVSIEPPPNWEKVYAVTKEMRKSLVAPVDTMGCERLAEPNATPRDQRFQTLIALMLSSQTKDTVTAVAMKNMQQNLPGGLTLETILSIEPDVLNSFIEKVGFHNNKTKYIKQAAQILKDKFNSDIPDTIEGLVSLPGVGPKMAYLCMSAAWGRDEGIGVDVHVHRITNLWGWHKTKTPEETRATLEAWLPREKWHDINTLLVGFGQTLCLPVGRKCGDCALAEEGLCPSAIVGKKVTVKKEKTVKEELEGDMKIKVEEQTENIKDEPITVDTIPTGGVVDIEDIGSGMPSRRRSRRVKGA